MVAGATFFGTGATMSGAVSWSGKALLVAAKVMPVQVVWINSGFATPEQYPRELMVLFWLSFRMMTTMQSSTVQVASSHGMEDTASAGTDWIHWWNVAGVTFVSAENGAQWMLACIGLWGQGRVWASSAWRRVFPSLLALQSSPRLVYPGPF